MVQTSGREGHIVLAATVRTLGAWPAGWRHPDAHGTPLQDPAILRSTALVAERAGLDFLFFGDWLATAPEFEFTDPYLLARVEPFAAVSYLAAITERIGLVATFSSSYAEPYTIARSSASIDLLSGGRIGLNVSTGAELRSARNFGWEDIRSDADRFAAAHEFIEVLRGLWDSWEDDAFVSDAASGQLIDGTRLHPLNYVGRFHASTGPLNAVRPPQGHPPIVVAGATERARQLASADADILLVSPPTIEEAVESYAVVRRQVAESGRDPGQFRILTSILPIVAQTREGAWEVYDQLVSLVALEDAATRDGGVRLPANRSIRALSSALGVPLSGVLAEEVVPARLAARFSELGKHLLGTVQSRSGRTVGGERPVTYRHLLVAHAISAPILVGSPSDIADHLETWFRASAVDGFTVLSAFLGGQFEAFTALVVPELQRRGLFRTGYEGSTLRDHLGLSLVENAHAAARDAR
ncbi:MAG: xenobiotic compound monooxygenase subunit [Microbacteriaceae bacterium]|jgi:FMN-dependent oxidoreductase (nitrilotriacetate monooxygenase family)|nr:xenobiotic compound monooxygenase subunit [Microbacteriaceae bacterium]